MLRGAFVLRELFGQAGEILALAGPFQNAERSGAGFGFRLVGVVFGYREQNVPGTNLLFVGKEVVFVCVVILLDVGLRHRNLWREIDRVVRHVTEADAFGSTERLFMVLVEICEGLFVDGHAVDQVFGCYPDEIEIHSFLLEFVQLIDLEIRGAYRRFDETLKSPQHQPVALLLLEFLRGQAEGAQEPPIPVGAERAEVFESRVGGDLPTHLFVGHPKAESVRFLREQFGRNQLVQRLLSKIHLSGELGRESILVLLPIAGFHVPIGALKFPDGDRLVVHGRHNPDLRVVSEAADPEEDEDQGDHQKEPFRPHGLDAATHEIKHDRSSPRPRSLN